jgi:hypothetical protein
VGLGPHLKRGKVGRARAWRDDISRGAVSGERLRVERRSNGLRSGAQPEHYPSLIPPSPTRKERTLDEITEQAAA